MKKQADLNNDVVEEVVVVEEQGGGKTAEQLASEEALNRAIPDAEAFEQGQGAASAEPVGVTDTANNLAQLLNFASMGLGMANFKAVSAVWNPTDNRRLADAAIPVLRKAAWGVRFIAFLDGETGVEEFALFMVAAPMVMGTYQAARKDLEAMKPKEQPKEQTEEKAAEEVAHES